MSTLLCHMAQEGEKGDGERMNELDLLSRTLDRVFELLEKKPSVKENLDTLIFCHRCGMVPVTNGDGMCGECEIAVAEALYDARQDR